MSVASATASFVTTALPQILLTWRCKNWRCREFICQLEWNGYSVAVHKCACKTETRLPEDAEQSLRADRRKW